MTTALVLTMLASLAAFVVSLSVLPYVVSKLPEDYFVRPPSPSGSWWAMLRTAAGLVMLTAGLAMLVLPGPGIAMLTLGLSLVELPAKHELVAWFVGHPSVGKALQQIRAKHNLPPLQFPPPRAPKRKSGA